MASKPSPPRFHSTSTDPSALGEPLVFPFSKRTAPNRFLKAAMSESMSSFDPTDIASRGIPSPALIKLYERWGQGGWGQILTGNIMIDATHLEAPGNAVIPADAPFHGPRFDAFGALAAAASRHGSLVVGQVSHPGRQTPAALQPFPISASTVQLVAPQMHTTYGVPREATRADLDAVVEGHAHAAAFLERAGFDGIMVHAAHGYLLAQFLSRRTNQRADEYGGSLVNRTQLLLEVAAAIKKRVGKEFVVGVKVNSVEFQDKGITTEEAVELCGLLEAAEFDYIETSGGTYEDGGFLRESTRQRESFFVDFAGQIADAVSRTKVYTTGGLKTLGGMLNALESVDGVGIARVAAQEPGLPNDILSGRISGAMEYQFGPEGPYLRLLAAGDQLKQLGNGDEPMDLSDVEVVRAWTQRRFSVQA